MTNYFIQTKIEHEKDMVIINICRILVDMLLDIAPDASERKEIKQLITQCMNVIYANMLESLL